MSWTGALALAAVAVLGSVAYLAAYFRWEARQTRGLAYFGRSPAERRAITRRIARRSWPAVPLLRLIALFGRPRQMPLFQYRGVAGPPAIASPDSFQRASAYRPRRQDVFVVTQMRSGTTWMQQLVFQIVTRGQGEFGTAAAPHLYAVSPWLECGDTVPVADAPALGEPATRIIKTHLPATLCPCDASAKYIYVARHPLACFASIVDFSRALAGPLVPSVDAMVGWFCSDRMYWSAWPEHVAGWWEQARTHDNVLFVHFEDMLRDLASVRARVAGFLGVTLTPEEARKVDERCSFAYMRSHEEWFEMARPTMFSVRGEHLIKGGDAARRQALPDNAQRAIRDYCGRALAGRDYPVGRFYPDLVVATEAHTLEAAPVPAPAREHTS